MVVVSGFVEEVLEDLLAFVPYKRLNGVFFEDVSDIFGLFLI